MRCLLLPFLLTAALAADCSRASGPGSSAGTGPSAQQEDRGAAAKAGRIGGAGPDAIPELEPNDSPETAQRIDATATVHGQIEPVQPATRPDEDWYLIQPANPPRDIRIQLMDSSPREAPDTGKFVLEVYDRAHDRIAGKTGELTNDPSTPLADLPALRVRDALYVRLAGKPFFYALRIEIKEPDLDSEAEPNDRAVDATALALDHPMHGSYASESDQDYYVVDLLPDAGVPAVSPVPIADAGSQTADAAVAPAARAPVPLEPPEPNEMLRIDVTGIPGVRHSLTLLDEEKTALGTFTSREPAEPLLVRDFALRPGLSRIYLLLESRHGHKRATADFPAGQPYTLTVHREPAPADLELEPNDTLDLATPLIVRAPGSGARRVGYLAPVGDVDDYRLHLDAPSRVHLTLSALEQVDTELSVVEPDASGGGKTLLKVNEGGTKEPEVIPAIALAAGDHIIRVQAAAHKVGTGWVRDQADPDHTYALEITLAPDDGAFEREPNDTAATATPIAPGQTLSGFAYPARDIDIYRLDLGGQPVAASITLRLSGGSKVPLELDLREAKDGKLGELLNTSDPRKAGLDARVQQKLDPGVYYLVVRPHPASHDPGVPQADAETPYRLSVQLE